MQLDRGLGEHQRTRRTGAPARTVVIYSFAHPRMQFLRQLHAGVPGLNRRSHSFWRLNICGDRYDERIAFGLGCKDVVRLSKMGVSVDVNKTKAFCDGREILKNAPGMGVYCQRESGHND